MAQGGALGGFLAPPLRFRARVPQGQGKPAQQRQGGDVGQQAQ